MEPTLDTLDEILDAMAVRPVYQPIVELATGTVVGHEALARGPVNSALEQPYALFTAADEASKTAHLDWLCRARALENALVHKMHPPLTLFLNVEPSALGERCPPEIRRAFVQTFAESAQTLRVMVEVTERRITHSPADLLSAIGYIRRMGWGVALDDVGANREALALMAFIHPDVIKLDLRITQSRPDAEIAEIVNAVVAQAERTGATVLAEGIETEEHLATAKAMGATLGQGWYFGYPTAIPAKAPHPTSPVPMLVIPEESAEETPFSIVQSQRIIRRGPRELLRAIFESLGDQAASPHEHPVTLASVQHADNFTARLRSRYNLLAEHSAFVAVLGAGMPGDLAERVRGIDLALDDPLLDEWTVAIVGPHFSGAVVARTAHGAGDADEFEFVVTYDRALVLAVAKSLMRRVSSAATPPSAAEPLALIP